MSEIARIADYRRLDSGIYAPAAGGAQPAQHEAGTTSAIRELPAQKETTPENSVGHTRQVRRLAHRVAEAEQLVELQNAEALTEVDTAHVRRLKRKGVEAEKVHGLRKQPALKALQVARARFWVTAAGLTALTCGLGWSTANVQVFAANGAPVFSPGWWLAFLVEPFLALALLTIVGAKAFLASRGARLTEPTVRRIEFLFLGLTLLMNTWPYLPGVADPFSVGALVTHSLGPIVAVCVVTVLPVLWAAIDALDTTAPTPSELSEQGGQALSAREAELAERVRPAIASGQCRTSVSAIGKHLRAQGERVGVPTVQRIHRHLTSHEGHA